jgi:hypothetical protein
VVGIGGVPVLSEMASKSPCSFPMLSEYSDNMGYPDVLVMPMSA